MTEHDRFMDWLDKAFADPPIGHGTYLALRPHVKEQIAAIESEARAAGLREVAGRIEAMHLIEPNDPDHPAWYFDGWHAALDQAAAILTEATGASDDPR